MKIEQIVADLSSQGKYESEKLMFESSLYYHASMLMAMGNMQKAGSKPHIKYYGIILAGSGSGKDFAFDTVNACFDIDERMYSDEMTRCFGLNTGKFSGLDPYDPDELVTLATNLPKSQILGLDGTREGLFSVARSQSVARFGALNLKSSEFGDIISGSSEMLSKLKEMYDGKLQAKVIKSENVNSISDITVNFMAFGSHAGVGNQARDEFYKLASSGMYRRSYILDVPNRKTVKNNRDVSLATVYTHISKLKSKTMNDHMTASVNNNCYDNIRGITEAAQAELLAIGDTLLEASNNNIHDEVLKAEIGALEMIEDLSYIIAFIEMDSDVDVKHVHTAHKFYVACRATTAETFKIKRPFKMMYEMIERSAGSTMSDMVELNDQVPSGKARFADEMLLVEEYAYQQGKTLAAAGTKVKRYSIETLPLNDNTKLVVSICIDNKAMERAVDYAGMEVPLFGENNSLEALVASKDITSFTLAHYEPSKKALNGHRQAESFISGQNVIGFDIDDSMDVATAIELLKPYTYLLYTTKSHQKEKNGKVLDRFRIIMPTKTTFYVDEEQHKELYDNVAELLGIQIYDRQTRNVSRLWFTNEHCEIFTNEAENIDVTATLPETKTRKKFIENMSKLATNYDSRKQASIDGFMKWFFANTSDGNRNDHIHRLGKFMKDHEVDYVQTMIDYNAMLDDPIKESELKNIIRSVAK